MKLALVSIILVGAIFLTIHPIPFTAGLVILLGCLILLWLYSLVIEDASVIDIFWGLGFLLLVWLAMWLAPGVRETRDWVLTLLVTVWALRLSEYIGWRHKNQGEDPRYRKWRLDADDRWWWQSFLQVFLLQGMLIWIISAPLLVSIHRDADPGLIWLDYVGVALWVTGFCFEAIGDWQMARFKARPENRGRVLDRGLWRLTRHPNYFGDAVLWWGYFCFAAATGGFMFVFSPVIMTWLLMKVSGVSLLEGELTETKPGYHDYVRNTPAFFPRLLPKK